MSMKQLSDLFIASVHKADDIKNIDIYKMCDTIILVKDLNLAKQGDSKGFVEFKTTYEMNEANNVIFDTIVENGIKVLKVGYGELNDIKATAFRLENKVFCLVSKLVYDDEKYERVIEFFEGINKNGEHNQFLNKVKDLRSKGIPWEEYDIVELPVRMVDFNSEGFDNYIEENILNLIQMVTLEVQAKQKTYKSGESNINHLLNEKHDETTEEGWKGEA